MGSRGAFISVDKGNFDFVSGGRHYKPLGTLNSNSNVKIIVQDTNNVKAPEFSHTPGRVYAVVKDGVLKHLAYYDKNHKQEVSIDLAHEHNGVKPHRHIHLKHGKNLPGESPKPQELELIKKIKKEFHLK